MSTSGDLDNLVKRVLDRARSEAATAEERAGKAVERQQQEAEAQRQRRRAAAEAAWRETAERRAHSVRAEAHHERRRAAMNAREMAVEDVFTAARQELTTIRDPAARRDLLLKLIREGVAALREPAVRVRVNAAELALLRSGAFPRELDGVPVSLDEQTVETGGGPVVTDLSGRVVFENTFEARLDRARDGLRAKVAAALRLDEEEGAR